MENKIGNTWYPAFLYNIPSESIAYHVKNSEIFAGMTMESIFLKLGILLFLYVFLKVLLKLVSAVATSVFSAPPDFSKYGSWSVVTGASDGIGKAIAFELASYGQNIILMARNKQKLEKVSTEIETKYKVKAKYMAVDFAKEESIYKEIEKFLSDYDVGVLVNNVGIGTVPGGLFEIPDLASTLLDITRVNVFCLYKLHEIVLPGMIKRGRGRIYNISSGTALRPDFRFPVYGATKAFGDYLSQSLHHEFAEKGIIVQSVLPFAVATKMIGRPSNNLFCRTAEEFAKSLLSSNSIEPRVHGCWQYDVLGFASRNTPAWLFSHVTKLLAKKMRADMLPDKKSC